MGGPLPRPLSRETVPLAPVDGIEGIADDRFLALIDDRRLFRDPDDIPRPPLEDLLAGAQAEQPFEDDDHLVIEHRPFDRTAVESRQADPHGLAELGPHQPADAGPARRLAEGLE